MGDEDRPTGVATIQDAHGDQEDISNLSWYQSVKRVLSNRNWALYLFTVWIYNSMAILRQYFTLYFREIGISYVLTGVLLSLMFGVNIIGYFVSGYLADNYDRRKLSILTMVVNGTGFLMLAFLTDFLGLAFAMIIAAMSSFTGTAGQAYQMQQVDRRLGGVANSLFTLGTSFGLVPLYVFGLLLDIGWGFVNIMQLMLFVAGILYLISGFVRAMALESISLPRRETTHSLLRDFIAENIRGLRLLATVLPVFAAVICVDAFSDSLYRFASLYFVNETLNFGFSEINLMFLITLAFSVPLTMYLGRRFDRKGGRRLTVIVYAVMPVAIGLLILAQFVPYVGPQEWVDALDSIYPSLSVILSLAFIGTAMKQINDILWFSILGTYIQKSLPRADMGKMLSLNMFIVMVFIAIGPIPAGIIYTLYAGLPLLYTVLALNIVILIVLALFSIEPRVSVRELEGEDFSY
ncbi:MFS transporter [Candidatus Thorarchaeota archaeon]|nr:MAG: MFS transporter [Candidatus Thorarchaeota archaeon]